MTNNLETLKALALAATPGECKILVKERLTNEINWQCSPTTMIHSTIDVLADQGYLTNPKTVLELIDVMEMMAEAITHALREHGGYQIKGETERACKEALARYEALTSRTLCTTCKKPETEACKTIGCPD